MIFVSASFALEIIFGWKESPELRLSSAQWALFFYQTCSFHCCYQLTMLMRGYSLCEVFFHCALQVNRNEILKQEKKMNERYYRVKYGCHRVTVWFVQNANGTSEQFKLRNGTKKKKRYTCSIQYIPTNDVDVALQPLTDRGRLEWEWLSGPHWTNRPHPGICKHLPEKQAAKCVNWRADIRLMSSLFTHTSTSAWL